MVAIREMEEKKEIQLNNLINWATVYIAHFHSLVSSRSFFIFHGRCVPSTLLSSLYVYMLTHHAQSNPFYKVGTVSKPALQLRKPRQVTWSNLPKVTQPELGLEPRHSDSRVQALAHSTTLPKSTLLILFRFHDNEKTMSHTGRRISFLWYLSTRPKTSWQ